MTDKLHIRAAGAATFGLAVLCAHGEPIESWNVFPNAIHLAAQDEAVPLVAMLTRADGTTVDMTAKAQFTFSSEGIVRLDNSRHVVPIAPGTTTLTVTYEGHSAQVAIVIAPAVQPRRTTFRNDVEPILMKAGCNSGACHGSAQGKDGFKLSLFGYDPHADYLHLTRESGARRIDVSDREGSLMLQKATTRVPHEGGKRLDPDGPLHAALARWIDAGAPDDPPDLPTVSVLEILPPECVLLPPERTQQLLVIATYSDGTTRDVTDLALLSSSDEVTAGVSAHALVTANQPGEAFIMARFATFAVVSQVIALPPSTGFTWPADITACNYIDEFVHAKLARLRITPSPVCSDATFLRFVYLDVLGVLPTPQEFARFMADERPDKRARLVDELLQRPQFCELWAMKWAELLRIESSKLTPKGAVLYSAWLRDAICGDMPIDKLVRALLCAEGGTYHNPPANFYLVETSPTEMAENVAQVFTGIRIQCAQCHNHPFERWTQDDYYSFAAFFAQVGRKTAEDPRESVIYNSGSGDVKHLRTGQPARPKFLAGAAPEISAGADRRQLLAEWLTSPDNPWFAASIVNRVWAHFLGRGIIDPPDDVRVSNPPSNPQLLHALAAKFVQSGYNLRALARDICNSRTYQLSSEANASNASDERNFSHARIRRLPAEALLEAIGQVTEAPEKLNGLPLGARATQATDAKAGSYFLETFGRPARQTACTCERRDEPTLSQALHLINGATITEKIRAANGRLERLTKANIPPEKIIEELYVAALARVPSAEELSLAREYVGSAPDVRSGLEDVFWAVLNSPEFIFNH